MTLFVVPQDGVICAVINDGQSVEMIGDLADAALELLPVCLPRLSALMLDFLAQHLGHRLGDALSAAPSQLACEPFGFRIFDVQGHGSARRIFPYSSYTSLFFLMQRNCLSEHKFSAWITEREG